MKRNKLSASRVCPVRQTNLLFDERLLAYLFRSVRASVGKFFFGLVIFGLGCGLAGIVRAQTPGSLDSTFGTGGKVVTAAGNSSDGISGIAIQTDGKIVAAGYAGNGTNLDFALARYNADGTLDTTFGTGGKVTTQVGARNDFASSVAFQSGKIVVAGYSETGTNIDFALVRYNADGTLDQTFGAGGKVVTPVGSLDDFASALAVQTDGKIVVAGATEISVFSNDFAVVRYNTDGTLDATFGTGGKVVTPIGSADDFASAIAIQADGKIVVAGASSDGTTDNFAAARYNANGTLDQTFGAGGRVTTPIGNSDDFASAVLIQADSKIVVAGDSNNGNNDFALVRYNTNGTLDQTFGTGGKVVTPVGSSNDYLNAAAIQANDKIVVAGTAAVATGGTPASTDDFAVVRYNADGTLDATFGTGGKVVTPIGSADDFASAIAIQADGKIVAAGSAGNGTNLDFALARYFGNNPNNPTPAITTLSPNNRLIGSAAFEITVTGSNFINGSVVRFNNQDRATTFVSETQLRAQITAADLQTAGQFPVTVFNPAPGGGSSNAVAFTVGACSYTLSSAGLSLTNAGGSGTVNVTTQTGCAYTAGSNASFITVTGGANGNGNGTVSFTVAANTGAARTGTVTIAGQTFTVQQGDGCTYALSASVGNYSATGGSESFSIITAAGCAFTATSNASFITVNNGTGTGSGTVTFTVAANTGTDRTGTITVNGQTFTVNQSGGCAYSLSPTSASVGNNGGTGSFTVTTGTGCTYTATSNASFITVNNGTGTGGGTVTFTVATNTGTDRTGMITVNGQTFTINQSGGCSYVLTPTNASFGSAGGQGTFTVTTGAGCTYTATASGLVTIVAGATGANGGVVTYFVPRNDSAQDRTAAISVNGQTFSITQSAGCVYSPSLSSTNFTAAGATGNFTITLSSGCLSPSVVSGNSWIIINSVTHGTGSSVVNFTVQPNTSTARVGTVGISGNSFLAIDIVITQSAGNAAARTAFDYDGDGKADVSVFRPDNGIWYLLNSSSGFAGLQFGTASDRLVPADYDGDGRTDVAVYRDGTWYLQRSTAGFTGIAFGTGTDIPAPADYDGDGRAELAVYRPSNGTWYFYNLASNQTSGFTFGAAEDRPVAGDYDGDGKADVAVFRPSTGIWYIQRSNLGFTGLQFGIASDKTVPADYDGDGRTDIAVFRDGTWYLQRSTAGFTGIAFGFGADLPTPADYDGDGRTDIAVFREGTWYLQRSTAGFVGVGFGVATDKPSPNSFVR